MAQMAALTSFDPNTTILSADTNSNNTTIRNTYNTHDTSTNGVHGVAAGAIVGTTMVQTLTNKTLTTPTINTGVFNAGTLSGTFTSATLILTEATALGATWSFQNSDATATANAVLEARVQGTAAGDPALFLTIPSGTSWYAGVDNSSSDAFMIGTGTTIGSNRTAVSVYGGSGALNYWMVRNDNNTAGSDAHFYSFVAGTSAGDPATIYSISGGTEWYAGVDNSDSDKFKIGTGTTVGTNTLLTITSGGSTTLGGTTTVNDLTVGGNFSTAAVLSATSTLAITVAAAGHITCAQNCTVNGELLVAAIDPPTANYANQNSFVKAWAVISSAGTILDSYNVSGSVTHASDGEYTFSWDTNFNSTNYACVATCSNADGFINCNVSRGAGAVTVYTYNVITQLKVDAAFSVMAIGTQ